MRVLVTGHDGYIGTVLVPMLEEAGHEVAGIDSYLFDGCVFGFDSHRPPSLPLDIRDVAPVHLRDFDAVIHLAGLSNDPLGDLNPEATRDINHRATIRMATTARATGVSRFLFASSCSVYGASAGDLVDEQSAAAPLTAYGESKLLCERDLSSLANGDFSPTSLRLATAYGVSPRLRGDLVVNDLTGHAVTTGKITLVSDGTSWRPLIHVEDIARAFLAVLEADRSATHNEIFNIGSTEENYRIGDVAELVDEVVPSDRVTLSDRGFHDHRSYRVDCDKLVSRLPAARPLWTVKKGIEQLYEAYQRFALRVDDLEGSRYRRLLHIQMLQAAGVLDDDLRRIGSPHDD